MKIDCNIIKDLIPSYVDNLTSSESNRIIEEHIKYCKECASMLDGLNKEFIISENKIKVNMKDSESKKIIKRIKKRMVSIVLVTLIVGIVIGVLGYYSSAWLKINNSETISKNFLYELKHSNFDEAFKYISYFDEATDLPPTVPKEEAKKIWIKRVEQLKEQGTYIKDYENVRFWIDDGVPMGEATLIVIENKREREYVASLQITDTGIQLVYEFPQSMTILEKAISGQIYEIYGGKKIN